MADPLSITVSSLTVIGVCVACAKQLRVLMRDFRKAPMELLALSNEVNDLRVVLAEAEAVCLDLTNGTAQIQQNIRFNNVLTGRLAQVKRKLEELLTLTESLSKTLPTGTQVNRLAWLKKRSTARQLQTELRDSRISLHMLLDIKNVSGSVRIELALQTLNNVSVQNHNDSQEVLAQILRYLTNSDSFQQLREGSVENPVQYDEFAPQRTVATSPSVIPLETSEQCNVAPVSPSAPTPLQTVYRPRVVSALSFCVGRQNPCNRQCDCVCHSRRRLRTPDILKRFVGAVFVGYSGLPVLSPKCSSDICRNRAACRLEVTYSFPSWFVTGSIQLVAAMTYTGCPVFGLAVQRRIDYTCQDTLFRHAIVGNNEGIRSLLETRDSFPDDLDFYNGTTALTYAIYNGHISTCELLIQEGADPHLENDFGLSPVQEAWSIIFSTPDKSQFIRDLEFLFSSIDCDDWEFSTLHKIVLGILPISLALQLQKPHIRAQVNLQDCGGRTPLHWAALRGDAHAVEQLLLAGANPNSQEVGGNTVLHLAARSQDPRCFELLVMAGADVHVVNGWGDQSIHCACNNRDVAACVKPLILGGALINCKTRGGGCTPLSQAAVKNNISIGSLLLELDADMYIGDKRGETPLFRAIFAGCHEFLELLLRRGDDCTNVTIHGSTVLHHTAQYGDIKVVNMLLSFRPKGINPDATDFNGRTAMKVLRQRVTMPNGFKEAFERLIESIRESNDNDSDDSAPFFDALEA